MGVRVAYNGVIVQAILSLPQWSCLKLYPHYATPQTHTKLYYTSKKPTLLGRRKSAECNPDNPDLAWVTQRRNFCTEFCDSLGNSIKVSQVQNDPLDIFSRS